MSATPKKQTTCSQCGRRFTPWRHQVFCSTPCRRRAENARVRGLSRRDVSFPQNAKNATSKPTENLASPGTLSRHEPLQWIACNEATLKCVREGSTAPLGWAILIEVTPGRDAWFGRVSTAGRIGSDSSGRSEFSFGPTTKPRAKAAVEARLTGQPFDKSDDSDSQERAWAGTCWQLMGGSVPAEAEMEGVRR